MGVVYRPSRKSDYGPLREVIRRTIEASPVGVLGCDDSYMRNLFGGRFPGFTAVVDGNPAGVALFSVAPSPFSPVLVGTIFLWVVRSEYRGQGIGRGLIEAVERGCSRLGASAMVHMPAPGRPAEVAKQAGYAPYKEALIKFLGRIE